MLHDTPELDLFLRAYAERKAPLTIFAGSGLSAPAGLPTWPKLERLLRTDVEKSIAASEITAQLKSSPYNALQAATDHWLVFSLIRQILGDPTFEGLVETYLSVDEGSAIPEGYLRLLELEPQGFVTLNLDRLAGDAVSQGSRRFSQPIHGLELAEKWNALLEEKPHLVYLHGDILNPSTWVLTKENIDKLLASEAHKAFIYQKYTGNLVLFAGVGADDIAVSARVISLREAKIRPKNLFWLTSRLDRDALVFAEQNYIKLIRYDARNNSDHLNAIEDLVSRCSAYTPQETTPELIRSNRITAVDTINPTDLLSQTPNDIRIFVAAKINEIVETQSGTELYESYRKFCSDYHFGIHQAFYHNNKAPYNQWFDYTLSYPAIGRGNFGEVYSAAGPDGNLVAVKIMNEAAFTSDDMLGGFRRGARSMRMVKEADLDGMVPLLDAYELPPTIVMPFVNGVSLQEAVERRKDMSWETKVRIGREVSSIVSLAHTHPSTILHRDLKPSNIMIQNFEYTGEFDPEVIVLDFDMSWHKGSDEKDVVFESRDDFGFLAPEQTVELEGVHARTTKVDSYGLGMTLYFLFGHRAPLANEPLNPDWAANVFKTVSRGYNYDWRSAPQRLARLIVRSTVFDQIERLDFYRLKAQLALLSQAIANPDALNNVEAWGEEILARIGSPVPYVWDDSSGTGYLESPGGTRVAIETDATNQTLTVKFEFRASGYQDRTALPRSLKQNLDSAIRELKAADWNNVTGNVLMGGLALSGQINLSSLMSDASKFEVCSRVYRILQI